MKAKLLKSTNLLVARQYTDVVGKFEIEGSIAHFGISKNAFFYTSYIVKQIVLDDNQFEIHTLNSTYTFKSLKGPYKRRRIKKADEKLLETANINNSEKFQVWGCSLAGLRSKVTLPHAMTKKDAEKYILEHEVVDDIEGCNISLLLLPTQMEENL